MRKLLLIPYPQKVDFKDGELDCRKFEIIGEPCFAAKDFAEYAEKLGAESGSGIKITYGINAELPIASEGYVLDADENGIEISASSDAGIRYAFCTLRQLYHNYGGKIPCVRIEDEPYLEFRSLLLDNGRYYFPKSDVLKFIDCCYLHKLNVLHWHLTEDQGWRIEIEKYPLLTEKGSKRSHTNFNRTPHGGFYTKSEIREIIAYANERGIEVIPEIDMPGHMQAALACYPELGCFDRKLEVATHWGVKHDVLCAGKESTYEFIFGVLEEVIELFGGNTKYIHIGGDEVFKHRWRLCPRCQAAIEREGLRDEHELQAYFMQRIADWLTAKGFIPMAWNGFDCERPVGGNIVLQYWNKEFAKTDDLNRRQAFQSKGFVNSSSGYTYIDLPYGRISLKKSYEFVPLPENYPKDKLLGAEMTLWTEYVPDFETGCKRLLPRSLALAEAMWRKEKFEDYNGFTERLAPALKYLKGEGFKGSPMRIVNPRKPRALAQIVWFERRQLHWQGLHNLIDDFRVNRKYSQKKK